MIALIVILVLAAAGMVAYSLIRGLHAFANMRPGDVDENGVPKSLTLQNKMMFARVKWQAVTILLIVVLLVAAGSR